MLFNKLLGWTLLFFVFKQVVEVIYFYFIDLDENSVPIINEFDSIPIYVLYMLIYANDIFILTGIFINIILYIEDLN
jgi:hypothetical protein